MCNCFEEASKNLLNQLREEHMKKSEEVIFSAIRPRIESFLEVDSKPKFGAYYEYEYRSTKKSGAKSKRSKSTIGFHYCPMCGEKYDS